MTLMSTNLARTLPRNSTEMSRNPFEGSTENMELQDYMTGANSTTTNCSPTGNSSPAPRFYGLPKIHKANCPMHPIVSACGMATYQLAKFLTKILQRYMGITPSFVKDSKNFSDHLRSVNISEEEELVSFDISALFTSIPVPHSLGCNQLPILWTHWGSWGQTQIWLLFQMEHHWPWERWGNATPKISLGELCLHLPGQVL